MDANKIARAVFDLIEAHQSRREPVVLAHIESVVEVAMRQHVAISAAPDKTKKTPWIVVDKQGVQVGFSHDATHDLGREHWKTPSQNTTVGAWAAAATACSRIHAGSILTGEQRDILDAAKRLFGDPSTWPKDIGDKNP